MEHQVRNTPFGSLRKGASDRIRREVTQSDLRGFATFAGDVTDHGVDRELAADPGFAAAMAQGGVAVGLFVSLVATRFPGPGSRLCGLSFSFHDVLAEGDLAIAEATVIDLDEASRGVTLDCVCRSGDGRRIATGRIEAIAPAEGFSRPLGRVVGMTAAPPPDRLEHIEHLARGSDPIRTAVVNPLDAASLGGALESAAAGLIEPVLLAPAAELARAADAAGLDISGLRIVDVPHGDAAADEAARLCAEGECAALMKGKVHTDTLLRAVLNRRDLLTGRRLSHVFVEDVPGYPRLLLVSDAAVNIRPDLAALRDIVQNAIDLAHAIGIERPKVALLSAVETVTVDMPSTIAAAAICKMADRGEITGADVDGPLAMDNAVSEQAARIKGIRSEVAGRADILIAPDIEAANILAKDLDYLAGAEAAGIALGAKVPIILTSRADTPRERRASAALAAVMAARNRAG